MGSVQDTIECPQCKGLYTTDFNYRTQEEYRHCSRCGRTEKWFLIRDSEGNVVLDGDGKAQMDYKLQAGNGSARISFKCGIAQLWSFSEPVNKEIEQAYLEALNNPEVNKEDCYLTSWDPQKNEVVAVFGSVPGTYDEFMGEEEES